MRLAVTKRVVALDVLPENWRSYFDQKLAEKGRRRASKDWRRRLR